MLALVGAATRARIPLVQLREKNLTTRTLYELAARSAEITRGTETRLLVNDRADIALAARADGCHLTTRSIEASVIRRTFGTDFLIGVSTHSLAEAQAARDGGADFAVFGPVFDTPSKQVYGEPVRLESLREASHKLSPFPLLAVGGIALENVAEVSRAGASGVAAIRLFSESIDLDATVRAIRDISSNV
ncbi:MAG: thiamine-phosphate pyrophosphorylase [Acidobacteriota bacterium]|nr:thiamine-phosphate pyrophosphorylase [Acidobacteriota bacterium]